MKFVFLNQSFHPDVVSSAQHLADLAAALAAKGHQVSVVTGRRAYDEPRTFFPRKERWRGVRVLRVCGTGLGKHAKWRRAVDSLSFLLLSCLELALIPRPDVIVALTSPPLIGVIGLIMARVHRARFVHWTLDLNPDEAIAAGWLRSDSLAAWLLERLSRWMLRGADTVIALDRFMQARLVAKGVASARLHILPPWAHGPEIRFDVVGRQRFRLQHGLAAKFVVMYSGNHSPCHPLGTVLRAAEALADKRGVVFCFVGGGSEFRRIQSEVKLPPGNPARHKGNILCLPYQSRSELSASLSAADLHLVVMGQDFVGIVHPCKIYNILAIGSPVIYIGPSLSPITDTLERVGSESSGSIAHGDVAGLVEQIERLMRSPASAASRKSMGKMADQSMLDFVGQLESLGSRNQAPVSTAPTLSPAEAPVMR
jgi:glycosyltransferase involved in cell wall biosynthesis